MAMSLLNCAEQCESVLRSHSMSPEVQSNVEWKRKLILAIAAMQVAATSRIVEGEAQRDALQLVIRASRDASEALDKQGLDRELRLCATCCERAASICAAALATADGTA